MSLLQCNDMKYFKLKIFRITCKTLVIKIITVILIQCNKIIVNLKNDYHLVIKEKTFRINERNLK